MMIEIQIRRSEDNLTDWDNKFHSLGDETD